MKTFATFLLLSFAAVISQAGPEVSSNQVSPHLKLPQPQAALTNQPPADLKPLVDKDVSITGTFDLAGKLGPYISTGLDEVYILPQKTAGFS
jgi:hypothetical protein